MMRIRRRRARIAYTLDVALLATLLVAVLASGCRSEQEQLEAHKVAATTLLIQNSQLREFLEKDLYELSGNVFISTDEHIYHESDVILRDGKLVIPDGYDLDWYEAVRQKEPTIVEIFEKFDCRFIALFQGDSRVPQKTLQFSFDDFRIGEDGYFAEYLSYSRDGTPEMSVKVFTDWYYTVLAYM
jgi:hypothetical protein